MTHIFFFLLTVCFASGSKILGLVPYHGRSHFIMFETLFKELAARGHEVDVVSHYAQKEKIPRYNDLSIAGSLPSVLGKLAYDKMGKKNFFEFLHLSLSEFGVRICENALNTTVAKNLRDTTTKYDLIITEIFTFDCMYAFAHHFKIPVVAVITNTDYPWGASRIGNPSNPSYVPVNFLSYGSRMNLFQRVWNTISYVYAVFYYDAYSMKHNNRLVRDFFGPDMPDLNDLIRNYTSLILINTHFSINYIAPKLPNLIEVAGIHIPPQKPLPEHIKKALVLENGHKGVIYMSFGSLIAPETLPFKVLDAFCKAFSELTNYKILWKGPIEKLPKNLTIPSNVHFEKWMPQRDLLCQPDIKLFISHGGFMGTQEGIYCGVPVLGLPIFADQELNIENSKSYGFALKLNFADVTKDTFLGAVKELLENPKYRENAKRISTLFRDRPQSALETAVYWVEYVLKYNGAPHLRSVAAELAWYEYFLVDVILILLSIFSSFVLCIYFLVSFLRKLFKTSDVKKIKVQ